MPVVGDHQLGEAALHAGRASAPSTTVLGVLHGVLDQVAERRDQLAAVAPDRGPRCARRARRSRCRGPRRAGGRARRAFGDDVADRHRLGERRLAELDARQLHQVVDRAVTRGATRRPSARPPGAPPPGRSRRTSASASTARAPTGVFSSWLMLATKSVRTASRRRRSLTSSMVATADAVGQRFGGDDDRRAPAARTARASGATRCPRARRATQCCDGVVEEQPHVGARARWRPPCCGSARRRRATSRPHRAGACRRPPRQRRAGRRGGAGGAAPAGTASSVGPSDRGSRRRSAATPGRRRRADERRRRRQRRPHRAPPSPSPAARRSCHSRSLAAWRSA